MRSRARRTTFLSRAKQDQVPAIWSSVTPTHLKCHHENAVVKRRFSSRSSADRSWSTSTVRAACKFLKHESSKRKTPGHRVGSVNRDCVCPLLGHRQLSIGGVGGFRPCDERFWGCCCGSRSWKSSSTSLRNEDKQNSIV
jgi:hypothetical protein